MTFAKPKGEPPVVSWERCHELLIDHTYQRMIEGRQSQQLILHIAENWDWRLCAPLTVSHRERGDEPGYYVIDGQHRLRAAEMRGDIQDLPVIISKFASYEDEARCFVSINSSRQKVTAIDRYHARVAAKEPLALKIRSVVLACGLTVTRHADALLWKPLEIAFPDAVGRALWRDETDARFALETLAAAWPDKPLLRGGDLFAGLVWLNRHTNNELTTPVVAKTLRTKRQSVWVGEGEKHRVLNETGFADRALGEVIALALGVRVSKDQGRGQRRFETVKPGGRAVVLADDHKAVANSETLLPTTRTDSDDEKVFKSGVNSRKIGKEVEKGDWKGFPIFTLTLEERATCPAECKLLNACYGNNMHLAHRFAHGPKLEAAIWEELRELQDEHPSGFVIRLHILGDFYSLAYVRMWQEALNAFPALNVFGYTAHSPDGEIGEELLGMAISQWDRFAMRFSGSDLNELAALVINPPETTCPDNAFICPAQKMQTACCATCTLCWSTDKNVAFLRH